MEENKASQLYRIFFGLLVLMVAVTIFFGMKSWRSVKKEIMRTTGESLALAAGGIADQIDRALFERYSRLLTMAKTVPLKRQHLTDTEDFLARMKQEFPYYDRLEVTDEQGFVTASTDLKMLGADRSHEPWFQYLRSHGSSSLPKPEFSHGTDEPMNVAFSSPITTNDGRYLGVISAYMHLSRLTEIFTHNVEGLEPDVEEGRMVEWLFLSEDGTVVLDSNPEEHGSVNLRKMGIPSAQPHYGKRADYLEEPHGLRQARVVTGYDHTQKFQNLPNLNGTVLVRMDRDTVLAPISDSLLRLGGLTILAMIPLLGFLIWIVRRLTAGNERVQHAEFRLMNVAHELERKNAELSETRNQVLAATRAKSEFLGTMSHEIRTPINGVLGMTGLLLDTNLTLEQQEFAETIKQSSEALLTIMNDILDFSKIEAGYFDLESIPFHLRVTVEETLDLFAEKAQAKGLELVGLVNADVPNIIHGDPGRLRQVLSKLLDNAIKFTEAGEVTLTVRKVEENRETQVIKIEVTDTGVGISSEALPRLFQSFSQADGSNTRKYGGTGLGLAICKQLVQAMGGEIDVSSRLGEGSQFWVSLRLKKVSDECLDPPEVPPTLQDLHICLVDDNATNLLVLQHHCETYGIRWESAQDGVEALRTIQAARDRGDSFDLAICDMKMPGLNGRQLGQHIKDDPSLAAIHLVLLTSLGKRGEAKLAQKVGFSAYLTKPIHQQQLYDTLCLIMGRSSVPHPSTPSQRASLITRHTLKESTARARPMILLADDNLINQKVAVQMLGKLGCRVDVVLNGKEVVDALNRTHYDLVFMDCQMPEMDGYQATAEVRRREASDQSQDSNNDLTQIPHIPIIALTASGMEEDRKKCLDAGMDDFISKPMNSEDLQKVLHRWVQTPTPHTASELEEKGAQAANESPQGIGVPQEPAHNSTSTVPTKSDQAILEPRILKELQELGGEDDHSFVTSVIEQYLQDAPAHIDRIHQAVDQNDPETLMKVSHTLKGSSQNVGASRLVDLCYHLEQMGQNGVIQEAHTLLPTLTVEWQHTREALEALTSKKSPVA